MAKDTQAVLFDANVTGAGPTAGTAFDARTTFGNYTRAVPITMRVTAIGGSGGPTVQLILKSSDTTSFTTPKETLTLATVNAVGSYTYAFATKYRYVRAEIAMTGTSPTSTVRVDAVQAAQ
jgi:hypothetical protein